MDRSIDRSIGMGEGEREMVVEKFKAKEGQCVNYYMSLVEERMVWE